MATCNKAIDNMVNRAIEEAWQHAQPYGWSIDPGSAWHPRAAWWRIPAPWRACVDVRTTFADALEDMGFNRWPIY